MDDQETQQLVINALVEKAWKKIGDDYGDVMRTVKDRIAQQLAAKFIEKRELDVLLKLDVDAIVRIVTLLIVQNVAKGR